MTATVLPRLARDQGGPGALLAEAVAAAPGRDVSVGVATPLPATFPLASERPRYTVRHLLQSRTVDTDEAAYLQETGHGSDRSGDRFAATPEARFTTATAYAGTTTIRARLPLPGEIVADPSLLAAAVDRRLVVRLCTVENDAFLNGTEDGTIPAIRSLGAARTVLARGRPLGDVVADTCALVEETGGSCDGIVVHPREYWRLVTAGLLGHLEGAGMRVSRTRMLPPGELLFADYRAALAIIDTDDSAVGLTRGRDGAQDEVWASTRVGLATPLPQHVVKVLLDEEDPRA